MVTETTPGPDATLSVSNHSSFEVHELYLTSVGSPDWGPNLLRGDVLLPGENLTLAITCGTYDAMLVDETNAQCELSNLDLCFNNADWVLTNNTCSVFAARLAAEKAAAEKASPVDAK